MLPSLSVIAFVISVILLYFNARRNPATIYLGIFFLLVTLYCISQYVILYSKSVLFISILLSGFAIVFSPLYLIGPALYLYVRSVLTDNSRFKKRDFWHLLPMIIYFAAALPYTFGPFSEKFEAAKNAVEYVGFIRIYKATFLSEIFSVEAIYLSRTVLIFLYTLWSVGMFMRYYFQKKLTTVFSGQYFVVKWLCLLLGFFLVLVITHTLLVIKFFASDFPELFFSLNFLRILSGVGLVGLVITPFFFPAILYGLPRVPDSEIVKFQQKDHNASAHENEKKNTNHFESGYLNLISRKADSYMNEFKPYLQSDFNLVHLSVQIKVPAHHLGYFFREVKKQHFIDYRNEWRIKHAKTLINEGKVNEVTLETIASLSGFPNRNSFYSTFKKFEGVSPGAFANRMKS
jgi:AraC-like DNA-binding protein